MTNSKMIVLMCGQGVGKGTQARRLIEDNGFNISGGEKQKIILARSLLKNSNYLIFDEALSEISIEEEKEILSRILKKYKDKTIIYISHKEEISTLFKDKFLLERRIKDEWWRINEYRGWDG